jgi:hypothetical protein
MNFVQDQSTPAPAPSPTAGTLMEETSGINGRQRLGRVANAERFESPPIAKRWVWLRLPASLLPVALTGARENRE